jgi:hypothetical protein
MHQMTRARDGVDASNDAMLGMWRVRQMTQAREVAVESFAEKM